MNHPIALDRVQKEIAMSSPRRLKLADQIKTVVAETLERRIKDPRLGFVTITDVRLTGDNRDATIFYTVLGSDTDQAGTAAALESATGLLRSTVGKRLGLRFAPTLTFIPDAVPETARQFEELLDATRKSDADLASRASQGHYAGEADPYRKPREDEDDEDVDGDDEDGDDEDGDERDRSRADA